VPSEKDVPGFGFSPAAYWVKVEMERRTTREVQWMLEFGYAPMQWIDVYVRSAGGALVHLRGGMGLPMSERPYRHHKHAFEVTLPDGEVSSLGCGWMGRAVRIFLCGYIERMPLRRRPV